MLPLIDLINHKPILTADFSDYTVFDLLPHANTYQLQFSTNNTHIGKGEQFTYTYHTQTDCQANIDGYGFAFEDNPHQQYVQSISNHLPHFHPLIKDMCKMLNCSDPQYFRIQEDLDNLYKPNRIAELYFQMKK